MSDEPLQYILSKGEWDYLRQCEALLVEAPLETDKYRLWRQRHGGF